TKAFKTQPCFAPRRDGLSATLAAVPSNRVGPRSRVRPRSAIAMTAQYLIDHLGMQRIPHEGCWFALTYRSPLTLPAGTLPARFGASDRAAGSAIYALVTRRDFSAMHRLAQDETWHFYLGDPIELL